VDVEGVAVAGATVEVSDPFLARARSLELFRATSDSSGSFEIRGVPAGSRHLVAPHADFSPAETAVSVPEGAPVETRLMLLKGGGVEGVVRTRGGLPLVGVIVNASSPVLRGPAQLTSETGSFAFEHVPPGQLNLSLVAEAGPGRTISGLSKTIEVREGETTTVELIQRDVLVVGRVVRWGRPLPGVNLRFWSEMGTTITYDGGLLDGVPLRPLAPERMHAVTSQDGTFALVVDEPGRYWVEAESEEGQIKYPSKMLEIAESATDFVEIAYSSVSVSGLVVDREMQQPIGSASVRAWSKGTAGLGGVVAGCRSDADGRFTLDVEPGDYTLAVEAETYAELEVKTLVGDGGVSNLRLELMPDKEIVGRVVDTSGRGVGAVRVLAISEDGLAGGAVESDADGTFRIGGLGEGRYNICGGSAQAGYGVRSGIRPGERNAGITLRPAGRVRLLVLDDDALPIPTAYAFVARVGTAKVTVPALALALSGDSGRIELATPAGDVEIVVRAQDRIAKVALQVPEGQVLDKEVTLASPIRDRSTR